MMILLVNSSEVNDLEGAHKVDITTTGKEEMIRFALPRNSRCLDGPEVVPFDLIALS